MTGVTLATLRSSIERIEAHGDAYMSDRAALGHDDVDAALQGGLAIGAMHVVASDSARRNWRGLDLRGAVLATASVGALVFAFSQAQSAGWTPITAWTDGFFSVHALAKA